MRTCLDGLKQHSFETCKKNTFMYSIEAGFPLPLFQWSLSRLHLKISLEFILFTSIVFGVYWDQEGVLVPA